MKQVYSFSVLFILLTIVSLFGLAQSIYAIDGFITIKSPAGGETLQVGNNYTIRWESSPNIDKVNIGYKSCPSCLDWVVFNTANTGSYDWNVNVGNTTQTQFTLQITGYVTGKGSLTSSSGTFTVMGGSNQTSLSNSSSSVSSSQPSRSINRTGLYENLLRIKKRPTPTPAPLTIYSIKLPSEFLFEGSQTTPLSKIKDPKHVKNFTLDTQHGWTATFSGELDLTDAKKLVMLRDMNKYWIVESWFIWIKVEWWEIFNTTCNITLQHTDLTGVQPKMKISENIQQNISEHTQGEKKTISSIKKASSGEVVFAVTTGGKIEVEPNVYFTKKPTNPVEKDTVELTALTSHKNLIFHLFVNGKESSISAPIKQDGSFDILIPKLLEGSNYIELQYKKNGQDASFVKADNFTVIYRSSYLWYIVGIILFIVLLAVGNVYWIMRMRDIKKKRIKSHSHKSKSKAPL